MNIPTALAPTVELATPRVRKFVDKILDIFGPSALIEEFFVCNPAVNVVHSGDDKWFEGNWGVDILADCFNTLDLEEIKNESETIGIGEASIYRKDTRLRVRLWLFARVMRW